MPSMFYHCCISHGAQSTELSVLLAIRPSCGALNIACGQHLLIMSHFSHHFVAAQPIWRTECTTVNSNRYTNLHSNIGNTECLQVLMATFLQNMGTKGHLCRFVIREQKFIDTSHPRQLSFTGMKVPSSKSSREWKVHETFAPWTFHTLGVSFTSGSKKSCMPFEWSGMML